MRNDNELWMLDGDQASSESILELAAMAAGARGVNLVVVHNGHSTKKSETIKPLRNYGVTDIVCPLVKNGADNAMASIVTERLVKPNTISKVVLFSRDVALARCLEWVCHRYFTIFDVGQMES